MNNSCKQSADLSLNQFSGVGPPPPVGSAVTLRSPRLGVPASLGSLHVQVALLQNPLKAPGERSGGRVGGAGSIGLRWMHSDPPGAPRDWTAPCPPGRRARRRR